MKDLRLIANTHPQQSVIQATANRELHSIGYNRLKITNPHKTDTLVNPLHTYYKKRSGRIYHTNGSSVPLNQRDKENKQYLLSLPKYFLSLALVRPAELLKERVYIQSSCTQCKTNHIK